MHYRLLFRNIGVFTACFGLLMLPSAGCAAWYQEWDSLIAFGESMAVSMTAGLLLMMAGRGANPKRMFQRETLGMVGMGWLATAQVGALPFIFAGVLGPADAFFESMSGLTTTGATVIQDIEACSKSILFWRSFTHWIGGMGIIVLFIAVLPYLGVGGKQLFKSESTSDPHALSPRIKDTASALWKIYLLMTVAQTVALLLAGMDLYDSLCHTFGTISTGGFSPKQASIAHYDSLAIELIILVFMVAGGANFALYFAMLRGQRLALLKDREFRAYIGILCFATALITANLMGARVPAMPGAPPLDEVGNYEFGTALRNSSFLVVSIMTTTGFGQDNFERWPYFSQMILVALMLVGGCAGSTSGGIKVMRLVILLKMIYWRVENSFRPKTIRPLRIGEQLIDEDMQRRTATFLLMHLFVFGAGSVFMSGLGLPPLTAITAVAATLNNIGPGLELVGPMHDFSQIPDIGKVFLSFCMAMGRLELFAILVLFVPGFWKHS